MKKQELKEFCPTSPYSPPTAPTYAGLKNVDAPSYIPTTTPAPTEEPDTTTTDIPTEPTTLFPDTTTDIPTTVTPPTDKGKPTTLKPGKLPVPKHDKVRVGVSGGWRGDGGCIKREIDR